MRCFHCKAEYDVEHFARIAENRFSLHWEDWSGWRFSGRYLIAPDRERFTAQRLRGIAWEQRLRSRIDRVNPPVWSQLVHLPARERFDGQA